MKAYLGQSTVDNKVSGIHKARLITCEEDNSHGLLHSKAETIHRPVDGAALAADRVAGDLFFDYFRSLKYLLVLRISRKESGLTTLDQGREY